MATLAEVEQTCLNAMRGVITDDLLETINFLRTLFDDELIECFNRFSDDNKSKVIIDFFEKPDLNWGRVGLLMILGKENNHLAPFIANHIAQWIHMNGGFDAMINLFARRRRQQRPRVQTLLRNLLSQFLSGLAKLLF